jgi:hypothetical protein
MLVSEDLVRPFNYYHAGQLCKGMSLQNRLYRLVSSFRTEERAKAYAVGCKLNKNDSSAVITKTIDAYNIWLDLRSPFHPEMLSETRLAS